MNNTDQSTPSRRRVLILCTANSARSQMAEGVLRHLGSEHCDAFSAGSRATYVNPFAVRAMDEIGVDIRAQFSKTFERYLGEPFDAVITVCDNAAAVEGDDAKLQAFRDVRDGLIARFTQFLQEEGWARGEAR